MKPVRCTDVPPDHRAPVGVAGRIGRNSPRCNRGILLLWFCCWMLALSTGEPTSAELTDWMKPITWSGNYWGPAATRARMNGQLPPLAMTPAMARWSAWGRKTLRDGDIVFRLGDARIMRGSFPLSVFIAKASGSPFSHTGIVAIEDGSPVVYDCALDGIQRQTFEVWMLECIGQIGVKRLKVEQQHRIPGVLEYCRKAYVQQVPFDSEFRMDDAALYCVEMTEKAFRSQGLALSEPVRIGDWENLADYTLTALAIPRVSGLFVERPITLEQPVYLPGNERHGVWASTLLETVFGPELLLDQAVALSHVRRLRVEGDMEMVAFVVTELRRSYTEIPIRLICRQARRRGSEFLPSADDISVARPAASLK